MNKISLRNYESYYVSTLLFDSYLEKPSHVTDPPSLIFEDF